MDLHYIIIVAIIAVIVVIQFRSYSDTKRKFSNFIRIFPADKEKYQLNDTKNIDKANPNELLIMAEEAGLDITDARYSYSDYTGSPYEYKFKNIRNDIKKRLDIVSVNHNNGMLATIIGSINDYLKSNKTVSDFHLMKDIVDRNCDAKEEEINTQIPIPLYMGLVGTMAGILVGILYLWLSGGISELLSAGSSSGADGVEALLGGVALAMIASIFGIGLTTLSSHKFKTAKLQVESNKHIFLSWIQAKLLPTLSDNVVGAIREMTGNFENFNKEFSDNTSKLGEALAKVNESYKLQTHLIDAVNKIQEGRTATTNLALLSKLIECSGQIGQLADYLKDCNQYLANVQALNTKLDNYDQRSQVIENAGEFFKRHDSILSGNIHDIKQKTEESLKEFSNALSDNLQTIKDNLNGQLLDFAKINENQQNFLKQNTDEINKIVKALSELGEVQKAVRAFENSIKGQNDKIDRLANSLEKWATAKETGGKIQMQQKTPILQIALISVIALSCTVLAVKSFMKDEPLTEKKEIVQPQLIIQQPIVSIPIDSVAVDTAAVVAE